MKPSITRVFDGALFLLTCVVLWNVFCGDTYAQNAGQPASKPEAAKRVVMTECEGIDNCTTWTFLSKKGYGKWRTGEEAVLEVESVKGQEIIISRTDVTGSKAGLTATYKGTVRAGKLGGEFEASYKGHDASGNWYAILGAAAPTLPTEMHVCGQACFTLTLENGHYTNNGSTWLIESFTRESVILNRTDPSGFRSVYRAQISSEGNRLVNVYSGDPGTQLKPSPGILVTWGTALDSIPGSGPRPIQLQTQPQSPQITLRDALQAGSYIKDWIDVYKFFAGDR